MSSSTPSSKASDGDLTDQAVLDYLRKRGMSAAAMELSKRLKGNDDNDGAEKSTKERLEEAELDYKNQKALSTRTTGAGYGYDRDSAGPVLNWAIPDHENNVNAAGVDEARAYVDAFVSLQLWVLGLPDEGFQGHAPGTSESSNPLVRAQALIKSGKDVAISSVIQELMKPSEPVKGTDRHGESPPSIKPELLSVTFALLIYTYFELLEVGMESTAQMIRDVFKPIYEPQYSEHLKDLDRCTTTSDVVQLTKLHNSHYELVSKLKVFFIKISKYEHERSELKKKVVDPQQQQQKETRISEYNAHIDMAKQRYKEWSDQASGTFAKMDDLPFLRRAKALRWQITLSNTTYTTLWSFLNNRDASLLPMVTLLQTKCELHIEKRPPLSKTPACVMLDDSGRRSLNANSLEINWASPIPQGIGEAFKNEKIPFPQFNFQDEYEDEKTAAKDKRVVEFNRSMLINGFRRLEALERKREFDGLSKETQKRVKEEGLTRRIADPFQPSILMSTLSADSPTKAVFVNPSSKTDVSTIWEESGIGICCAKLCQPDGRRVAAGCDDAAVRVWSLEVSGNAEPHQVLLGHKNGLPIFDVDWNRDGRHLLSAGGDGSVRLWDTMATGPIGENAPKGPLPAKKTAGIEADVPGAIDEARTVKHGAELAVYRGHTPGSSVWSVSYAPSGYYFVTGGADSTARLWTTDRNAPVRLLAGHTSNNVNCVTWHPNCNYVLSGADDRTARLWDVHTGRTVRLLTGCHGGIHTAKISPSGRYAAASDFRGIVYLWDLGTGKLMTEMCQDNDSSSSLIHALSFSACGNALAAGGEDCCIKIWDVRKDFVNENAFMKTPSKSYKTKRSMAVDLCFTRRNLLLAAGKVLIPTQVAPPSK